MKTTTFYGVVLQTNNGGISMKSFDYKEDAIKEAEILINAINLNSIKGVKVFLSELLLDNERNILASENLIDDRSELIFSNI